MSQSVKLSDGSYIDTEGIYDATQAQTQDALNAKLARLGTLLQGKALSTATSWTSSSSKTELEWASLTLPEGKWLVFAHWYDKTGYLRVDITAEKSGQYRESASHDGAETGRTMDAYFVGDGGQTVTLKLASQSVGKTYTWANNGMFFRLCAVCIG